MNLWSDLGFSHLGFLHLGLFCSGKVHGAEDGQFDIKVSFPMKNILLFRCHDKIK
jgi:hypothetical protein